MPWRLVSAAGCLLLASIGGPPAAGSPYSEAVVSKTKPVLYWGLNETRGPAKDSQAMRPADPTRERARTRLSAGTDRGPATVCRRWTLTMRRRAFSGRAR